METLTAFGEILTRRVRPRVRIAGRIWPVYGVCVCSGAVLGATWMVALAAWSGTSPLLALAGAVTGIAAALAFAFATKAATGTERFTFYHYQLTVLAAGGGAVAWAGGPVLPCLDLLAAGLAVVQAVGRLGCLGAGCCHGRAVPWGVRYGHEHAEDGFPRRLVGVPLLPVQAAESSALFALAAVGSFLVTAGPEPGSALALYLAGYGAVRFLLERWRGDRRPSLAGLSEAQWTALSALAAVVALGAAGWLPLGRTGFAAGLALLVFLGAVALVDRRRLRQAGGLLDAPHATEVAAMLARLEPGEAPSGHVRVTTSSRGLRLSTTLLAETAGPVRLVSFSSADRPLDGHGAAALARYLLRLCPEAVSGELLAAGEPGIWHLLAQEPSSHAREGRQT